MLVDHESPDVLWSLVEVVEEAGGGGEAGAAASRRRAPRLCRACADSHLGASEHSRLPPESLLSLELAPPPPPPPRNSGSFTDFVRTVSSSLRSTDIVRIFLLSVVRTAKSESRLRPGGERPALSCGSDALRSRDSDFVRSVPFLGLASLRLGSSRGRALPSSRPRSPPTITGSEVSVCMVRTVRRARSRSHCVPAWHLRSPCASTSTLVSLEPSVNETSIA